MATTLDLIIKGHDQASPALKSVGDTAHGVSSKMVALAGAAAGAFAAFGAAKMFSGAIGAAQQLGSQVSKLNRETGMSAESASRLLFAFQRFGLSGDDASRSLGILAKKLQGVTDVETGAVEGKGAAAMLADMGIAATDAAGKLRPMEELIPSIADKFKAMPNGIEKTGLAMQLFGRSGKDMIPVLNQGSEGLAELAKTSDKLGLTLSAGNLQKIKDYSKEQKLMKLAIAGLKLEIGLALMPVLTKLAEWMVAAQPAIRAVLHDGIMALTDAFNDLYPTLQDVYKVLANDLFPAFKDVYDKFTAFVGKKAELVALFAVIATGFLLWAATAVVAAAGTLIAMAPIIALFAAVGILAGGLVVLDEKTGIVTDSFNYLSTQAGILWDWLGPKLSEATENLVQLWNTNLYPALTTVGNFLIDKLEPVLGKVVGWLEKHPEAVAIAVGALGTLIAPWAAVGIAGAAAAIYIAAEWDKLKNVIAVNLNQQITMLNKWIRAWNSVMDTEILGKRLGPHIGEIGYIDYAGLPYNPAPSSGVAGSHGMDWVAPVSGTGSGQNNPGMTGAQRTITSGAEGGLTVNFNSTISTASPGEMQRAAIQIKSLLRGSL